MLGNNFINILFYENIEGFVNGYIIEKFLKVNIIIFEKRIYLCGFELMMEVVERLLINIGIDLNKIIKEKFWNVYIYESKN